MVKTELIEMRTVVKDKKGRIIEDLKKEDFELLENDQPQGISFFSISSRVLLLLSTEPLEITLNEKSAGPSTGESDNITAFSIEC